MNKTRNYLLGGLLFSLFFELGFTTWWRKQWGDHWSPVVLLLMSLAVCFFAYQLLAFEKEPIPSLKETSSKLVRKMISFSIFGLGVVLVGMQYQEIMQTFPVNPDGAGSDVIPSLQLYVQRFLAGEYPYQPLVFAGWTVMPTYFPMMWLPYCFSEILNLDYRWTAFLVFLIPIFILFLRLSRQEIHPLELAIKAALPFVYLSILMLNLDTVFGYGVELMPIGIYFLLTLTLMHRSPFVIALPIVCILLSRYAFTFWLPVYLLIIWIERGFKEVFQVSIWVLAGVLLIYVIPFLSKDWDIFFNGLKYYGKTAETAWAWDRGDGRPLLLIEGFSTSIFYFDFVEGTLLERLTIAKRVHLIACGLAAIIMFVVYWKNRLNGLNIKIFLLIALKFYIVIFYGFFYVPFKYLFLLPLLLSIPIVYKINWKGLDKN